MITLSYGFKKPQTGDKGDVFFPALEFDIQRINDHNHDGTNSALLSATSIAAISQTVLAAGWAPVVGQLGTYSQTITVPLGVSLNNLTPLFKDNTSKNYLNLTVQMLTVSTFSVSINDNTIDLAILYT